MIRPSTGRQTSTKDNKRRSSVATDLPGQGLDRWPMAESSPQCATATPSRPFVAKSHRPHAARPDNDRMTSARRTYHYVGQTELIPMVARPLGVLIDAHADLDQWMARQDHRDLDEPFTFVVDL